MIDGVRVLGVGNVIFACEDLRILLEPASLQNLGLRAHVLGNIGSGRTPRFSGTKLGTCVHGLKLSAGGLPSTKAVLIGDATRSN